MHPAPFRRFVCALTVIGALLPAAAPAVAESSTPPPEGVRDQRTTAPAPSADDTCRRSAYPGFAVTTNQRLRQSFVASREDLVRLRLCVADLAPGTRIPINFYEGDDPADPGAHVAAVTVVSDQGINGDWLDVRFREDPTDPDSNPVTVQTDPGKPYIIEVAALQATFQWRATCGGLLSPCGVAADRYVRGRTNVLPDNSDFGFETYSTVGADLTGRLADGTRPVMCPGRPYDVTALATNDSSAGVAPFLVDLFHATDAADPATWTALTGGRVRTGSDPVPPDSTLSVPAQVTVPAGIPAGPGELVLRVDGPDDDAVDNVVETDETNNVSSIPIYVTGCDHAQLEVESISTDGPSVPVGADEIPIDDIPAERVPFGASGAELLTVEASPGNISPGNISPGNISPGNISPGNISPIDDSDIFDLLDRIPVEILDQVQLSSVRFEGSLADILGDRTTPDGQLLRDLPPQRVTLADLRRALPDRPTLRWRDVDLSQTVLRRLTFTAVVVDTPLADLLPQTPEQICASLLADGFDCAGEGFDPATDTQVVLDVLGFPPSRVAFDQMTLDVAAIAPASPLMGAPLRHDHPAREFHADLTPIGAVRLADLTALTTLVDCADPEVDCAGGTVSQAQAADAFLPGVRVRDLLAALPTTTRAQTTVSDLVLGMLGDRTSHPWHAYDLHLLDLPSLDDDAPLSLYTISARSTGPEPVVDADVSGRLPRGFHVVEGTSTVRVVDPEAPALAVERPIADPVVTRDADGRPVARWDDVLLADGAIQAVPVGHSLELRFAARAGLTLGQFTSDAGVAGLDAIDTYDHVRVGDGAVVVVERHEPTEPVSILNNSIVVSHVGAVGDRDEFHIPLRFTDGEPVPARARLVVTIGNQPVDLDAALYPPDRVGGGTASDPTGTAHVVPQADDGAAANDDYGSTPPESVEVSPGNISPGNISPGNISPGNISPGNISPLDDYAIGRGLSTETLSSVVSSLDDRDSHYTVVVAGANGAESTEPYSVTARWILPFQHPALESCNEAPRQDVDAAALPQRGATEPLATATHLFLADELELARLYGTERAGRAMDAVHALAAQVGAHVADLGSVPTVQSARAELRQDPCDVALVNELVRAVHEHELELIDQMPQFQDVSIIGSDQVIPMRRVRDDTDLGNQVFYATHLLDLSGNNAVSGTAAASMYTSDLVFGTDRHVEVMDDDVTVPKWPVGRITGDPETIEGLAALALGQPQFNLDTAVLAATEFHKDSTSEAADHADALASGTVNRLISDAWTADDLRAALPDADGPRLAVLNTHASHQVVQPPAGTDLYDVGELTDGPGQRLLVLAGCNVAQPLADNYPLPADLEPRRAELLRSWVDRAAQQGTGLFGSTGFAYGDSTAAALTEVLARDTIRHAAAGRFDNVGQIHVQTLQDAWANAGLYGAIDVKVMQEWALFTWPFLGITGEPAPAPAEPGTGPTEAPSPEIEADPNTGLPSSTVSVSGLGLDTSPATTCTHCYDLVEGSDGRRWFEARVDGIESSVLSLSGRPLVPQLHLPATDADLLAHGFVVESYTARHHVVDQPAFARGVLSDAATEPAQQPGATQFPTAPGQITTTPVRDGLRQQVNLIPAVVRAEPPSAAHPDPRATVELHPDVTVRTYFSSSDDHVPPEARFVLGEVDGDVVLLVRASDWSGIARVLAHLQTSDGQVHTFELGRVGPAPTPPSQPGDPVETELWTHLVPDAGDIASVRFYVVDGAGNVRPWSNKLQRPELEDFEAGVAITVRNADGTIGPNGANGWYVPVDLDTPQPVVAVADAPGVDDLEYRLDEQGDFLAYPDTGVEVAGTGHHVFEIRGTGVAGRVTIPIDWNRPTITTSVPEGRTYLAGEHAVVDFGCGDVGSGLARCDGTQSPGEPLDTTLGMHVYTVAAHDVAGLASTQTTVYEVVTRYDKVGFLEPIDDAVNRHSAGANIAFRLEVFDAATGTEITDPSIMVSGSWQQFDCAQNQTTIGDPVTLTAAGMDVHYDEPDHFHFDLKASDVGAAGGECWRFTLRFDDDSTLSTAFALT